MIAVYFYHISQNCKVSNNEVKLRSKKSGINCNSVVVVSFVPNKLELTKKVTLLAFCVFKQKTSFFMCNQVELESSRSESANRIQELKERLSIEEHQMESHKRHHKEMLSDLKLTQDALQHSEAELEEMKNRFEDLLQKERC